MTREGQAWLAVNNWKSRKNCEDDYRAAKSGLNNSDELSDKSGHGSNRDFKNSYHELCIVTLDLLLSA